MKFVISSQNRDAFKTVLSKFEVGYVALYGQRLSLGDASNSWVLIDQNDHMDIVGDCSLTLSTVDPFDRKSLELLSPHVMRVGSTRSISGKVRLKDQEFLPVSNGIPQRQFSLYFPFGGFE